MDETARLGALISVPLYVAIVSAIGIAAFVLQRRDEDADKASGVASDSLAMHYLGGRSFGPLVTSMTFFAAMFSGYSVVGIPDEAYRDGFTALRFLMGLNATLFGQLMLTPRLRRVGIARGHQSATDFITDRNGSHSLRITVLAMHMSKSWIYLTAQVRSLALLFNRMLFDLPESDPRGAVVLSAVIVLVEWLGGLKSVAWTDALQGSVMLVGFICLPLVMLRWVGPLSAIDLNEFPQPTSYQVPTLATQMAMLQFGLGGLSYNTWPFAIQRLYAAKNERSIKAAWAVLALSPWIIVPVGVYLGVEATVVLNGTGESSALAPMLGRMASLGLGAYVISIILLTAALSSICSTADSVLISISQLAALEVTKSMMPKASDATVSRLGKVWTALIMSAAVCYALLAANNLSVLIDLQIGLSLQSLPAFLLGLYGGAVVVHPWVQTGGIICGVGAFLAAQAASVDGATIACLTPGTVGFVANAAFLLAGHTATRLLPKKLLTRPQWDMPTLSHFGARRLDAAEMTRLTSKHCEPSRRGWYVCAFFALQVSCLPIINGGTPSLDGALDADGTFSAAAAASVSLVGGVPEWAAKLVAFQLALSLCNAVAIYKWTPLAVDDKPARAAADVDSKPTEKNKPSADMEPDLTHADEHVQGVSVAVAIQVRAQDGKDVADVAAPAREKNPPGMINVRGLRAFARLP